MDPAADADGGEREGRVPKPPPGARCFRHPDRPAEAACSDCRRPVCSQCAPLAGGGHVFCAECLARGRLVDAEPNILGSPAEDREGAGPGRAPAARGRMALRAALIVLALLAAAAALIAWAASA